MNQENFSPISLTLLCLVSCAGLLAAGLWPFNFRAENHVALIAGGGLKFSAPGERSKKDLGGLVFTPAPLVCPPEGSCTAGQLSIELRLKADSDESSCLKRILDLRKPNGGESFYIGQWKSTFVVRSFNTPPAGGKPFREIGVSGVLVAGLESIVTLTSGPDRTVILVDGQPLRNFPGVRLLGESETLEGHRLYLGNAPDLNCPWSGDVLGLALYGRALNAGEAAERHGLWGSGGGACDGEPTSIACWRLDRPEGEMMVDLSGSGNTLAMPRRLVFEKPFLGLPAGQGLSISDITLNVLGFVPFGFLIGVRLRMSGRLSPRRCLVLAAAAGFAVSLVIELVQTWLPGRDSSLLDLVANTVGTAIGVGALLASISIAVRRPAASRRSIF